MTFKKKFILLANMLLCATLFCACEKGGANPKDSNEKWEDAYKEIVRNMESYLADPYIFRYGTDWVNSDSYIGYIGIHDFNDDNIPELIIGDGVSVGIFTYDSGIVKKIADLYEPEDWGCINGVCYKNNTIILTNSGSNGSCYVCFTYDDGEKFLRGGKYVIGIYDEYNPDVAIINEKVTTEEEFREQFNIKDLLDNSSIPRSRIKKDNGITTSLVINVFEGDDEYILIEDLDFNAIIW